MSNYSCCVTARWILIDWSSTHSTRLVQCQQGLRIGLLLLNSVFRQHRNFQIILVPLVAHQVHLDVALRVRRTLIIDATAPASAESGHHTASHTTQNNDPINDRRNDCVAAGAREVLGRLLPYVGGGR
jgi:hypothetical protein